MPELPEVETIRGHLAPHVEGRTLEAVEILDARWCRPIAPEELTQAVQGRQVERLARRGKYLVWELSDDVFLLMHLRMTGTLLLDPAPVPRHMRVRIDLGDHTLAFDDPRRFGTGELALGPEALDAFFDARLGVEPLEREFTGDHLYAIAQTSRAPVKAFLLDQKRVAGVGNIYADEALFRARLHPLSPAGSMKLEHCEDLAEGIIDALQAGLELGGSSIDDYRDARGERGGMQEEFLVHTREGKPCVRCDGTVRRIVVTGRSTYFCPGCQRRLRARPRRRKKARA
jgi:formamidopyrimidine-DNA glycosylase